MQAMLKVGIVTLCASFLAGCETVYITETTQPTTVYYRPAPPPPPPPPRVIYYPVAQPVPPPPPPVRYPAPRSPQQNVPVFVPMPKPVPVPPPPGNVGAPPPPPAHQQLPGGKKPQHGHQRYQQGQQQDLEAGTPEEKIPPKRRGRQPDPS